MYIYMTYIALIEALAVDFEINVRMIQKYKPLLYNIHCLIKHPGKEAGADKG